MAKCNLDEKNTQYRMESGARLVQNSELQPWWNLTEKQYICPPACCKWYSTECQEIVDNTGQPILPDEEVMLIQGGITSRDRLINGTKVQLFDRCDYYDERFDINPEKRPEHYKTCAEEIL